MTIHTDTFPLVCQQAANNPTLSIIVTVRDNRYCAHASRFSGKPDEVRLDVTALFTERELAKLATRPQPIKLNVLSSFTFKHLLERLHPGEDNFIL